MRVLPCCLVVASVLLPRSPAHAQSQEAGRPSAEDLSAAYLAFITGRSLEAAGDVEGAAASHRRAAALDPPRMSGQSWQVCTPVIIGRNRLLRRLRLHWTTTRRTRRHIVFLVWYTRLVPVAAAAMRKI